MEHFYFIYFEPITTAYWIANITAAWCTALRWILWTGLWGEDLRSTSGLELGAQNYWSGSTARPIASRDWTSRPEVDLRSSSHCPVQRIHLWWLYSPCLCILCVECTALVWVLYWALSSISPEAHVLALSSTCHQIRLWLEPFSYCWGRWWTGGW